MIKDPIWKLLVLWVCLAGLLILLALLFSSCTSKIAKAKRTLDANPEDAARYCADKFPVRDSIVYKDSVHLDTLYFGETYFDTIEVQCPDTVIKVVTKIEPKTIVKTVTQTKEIYRENTAMVEKWRLMFFDAQKKMLDAIDKYNKEQEEKKMWRAAARKWKWILIAVIAFIVGWKFRSPLLRLFKF